MRAFLRLLSVLPVFLVIPSVPAADYDGFILFRIACSRAEELGIPGEMALDALEQGVSTNHLALLEQHRGLVLLMEQAEKAPLWNAAPVEDLDIFSELRVLPSGWLRMRALVALKALSELDAGKERLALARIARANRLGRRLIADGLSTEFLLHGAARAIELRVQQRIVDALPEPLLHPSLRNALHDLEEHPDMLSCWRGDRLMQSNSVAVLYGNIRRDEEVEGIERRVLETLDGQNPTLAALVREEGVCTLAGWEGGTLQTVLELGETFSSALAKAGVSAFEGIGKNMKVGYAANATKIPPPQAIVFALRDLSMTEGVTEEQLREFHQLGGTALSAGMLPVLWIDWSQVAVIWMRTLALERISVLELAARVYRQKEGHALQATEQLVSSGLLPAAVIQDPFSTEGAAMSLLTDDKGAVRFESLGPDGQGLRIE